METQTFGRLGDVSALTLGGGGIGQVWGETTHEECVATVREAIDSGISFLDVAPSYGNGEAEAVVGEAFDGRLPDGVRVSTKSHVGAIAPGEVLSHLEGSLDESLRLLRLERVDLFILHGNLVPSGAAGGTRQTPIGLFFNAVRPAFERLVERGRIGAWGISGIGEPGAVLEALQTDPAPWAVQAISNLLDSPGGTQRFDGPAQPRNIIAMASERGVGVMGIRAVQAGALTDRIDRDLPAEHPEMVDFRRAMPFRELARKVGESPASLAHRYALAMNGVSTVVLGVKNRAELRECVAAEERGPLEQELISAIDEAAGR